MAATQKLQLTHEQAERRKQRSGDFEKGYQHGWHHQPEPNNASKDFKQGYLKGWNDKVLDGN